MGFRMYEVRAKASFGACRISTSARSALAKRQRLLGGGGGGGGRYSNLNCTWTAVTGKSLLLPHTPHDYITTLASGVPSYLSYRAWRTR